MVNFINGVTPLNDTNLNKLQTDLKEEIEGTTIFDYQNDVTRAKSDTISFSENLNQGDLIEIVFARIKADSTLVLKTTGKLNYFAGMIISLDMLYNTATAGIENNAKRVIINSNGLTTENKSTDSLGIIKIVKYTN